MINNIIPVSTALQQQPAFYLLSEDACGREFDVWGGPCAVGRYAGISESDSEVKSSS